MTDLNALAAKVEGLSDADRKYLERLICGWCDQKLSARKCGDVYAPHACDIRELRKAALRARAKERGWRSIADDPPAHGQANPVIIAVTGGDRDPIVGEAYFNPEAYGGTWWWAGTSHGEYHDSAIEEINHGAPTHWMPLPAPPEGGE